jgi:hypothetical protein
MITAAAREAAAVKAGAADLGLGARPLLGAAGQRCGSEVRGPLLGMAELGGFWGPGHGQALRGPGARQARRACPIPGVLSRPHWTHPRRGRTDRSWTTDSPPKPRGFRGLGPPG